MAAAASGDHVLFCFGSLRLVRSDDLAVHAGMLHQSCDAAASAQVNISWLEVYWHRLLLLSITMGSKIIFPRFSFVNGAVTIPPGV